MVSIFWPRNFTTKCIPISLKYDVVNTCFWCITLSVISNNYPPLSPLHLYLWVDIWILFCFYSLEQLLIKKPIFLFFINTYQLQMFGIFCKITERGFFTLPSQTDLSLFTQTIEPSVIISSSLSIISLNLSPEEVDASNSPTESAFSCKYYELGLELFSVPSNKVRSLRPLFIIHSLTFTICSL